MDTNLPTYDDGIDPFEYGLEVRDFMVVDEIRNYSEVRRKWSLL